MQKIDEIVEISKQKVRVQFGGALRDDWWSIFGGQIQAAILLPEIEEIVLNFEATKWADPIPLLSLACMLAPLSSQQKVRIFLKLGRLRNSQDDRFLLFAASQGFLRILSRRAEFEWNGKWFSEPSVPELEEELKRIKIVPIFVNADCIKATLIPTNKLTKAIISEQVEEYVSQAHKNGVSRWLKESSYQRGFLLHKLRQILIEALDNIGEHAYASEGYGAIFARIRAGMPEDIDEFQVWNSARVNERRHSPALARNNSSRQPGWLELFISDSGRGLTTGLTEDVKAPLLSLSNKLFRDPLSRVVNRDAAGKTRVTGLQHIGLLLQNKSKDERGDFVRIFSSGEWLGEHLPWPVQELQAAHRNYRQEAQPSSGTSLHFAIEPSPIGVEEQRRLYPGSFLQPAYHDLQAVRTALSSRTRPLFAPPYNFFDRSGETFNASRGDATLIPFRKINAEAVIIRPSRATRKADLLSQISQIRGISSFPVRTIVYADLPPASAIDFALILQRDRISETLRKENLSVFVLSQDWFCAGFRFKSDDQTFYPDQELAREFLTASVGTMGASLVAEILRERDSEIFWTEIGDAYLNESVVWPSVTGDRMDIEGYVDLPIALSRSRAFDSGKRAMRRTIASFTERNVITSDSLCSSLIADEFNVFDGSKPVARGPGVKKAIAVGSVLVTGSTSMRL
jgi:hypothetical protein